MSACTVDGSRLINVQRASSLHLTLRARVLRSIRAVGVRRDAQTRRALKYPRVRRKRFVSRRHCLSEEHVVHTAGPWESWAQGWEAWGFVWN